MRAQAITFRIYIYFPKGTSYFDATHSKFKILNSVKVHLTPKIFFAKIIRLVSWSNVAQKFFELVKSSNFYAPSKYVKMPPFWFATEFNGAWVEGRM